MDQKAASHFREAMRHFGNSDNRKGLEYLEKAIELDPNNVDYHWTKSVKLYYVALSEDEPPIDKQLVDDAIKSLTDLIKLIGKRYEEDSYLEEIAEDAYRKRAQLYQEFTYFEEAIQDLSWLIESNLSDNFIYYQRRGQVYDDIGRYRESVNDLVDALKLAPQATEIREDLVRIRYQIDDYDGIIKDTNMLIRQAEREEPKDTLILAYLYHYRGKSYLQLGIRDKALVDFRRAIEYQGSDQIIQSPEDYVDILE